MSDTRQSDAIYIDLFNELGLEAGRHWRLSRETGITTMPALAPIINYIIDHPDVYQLIVHEHGVTGNADLPSTWDDLGINLGDES